jgi:hypothetical protein
MMMWFMLLVVFMLIVIVVVVRIQHKGRNMAPIPPRHPNAQGDSWRFPWGGKKPT